MSDHKDSSKGVYIISVLGKESVLVISVRVVDEQRIKRRESA